VPIFPEPAEQTTHDEALPGLERERLPRVLTLGQTEMPKELDSTARLLGVEPQPPLGPMLEVV